jgi:hypothetical protein
MAQKKLIQGYSSKSIGKNIAYETAKHPGQSHAQNIAIALSTARKNAPANMKSHFTQKKKGSM